MPFIIVYLISCILVMLSVLWSVFTKYVKFEIPKKVDKVLDIVFVLAYTIVCAGTIAMIVQNLIRVLK